MIKPILDLTKFTLIFIFTTVLPIGLYFFFQNTPSKSFIARFSPNQINDACLSSPKEISYTECFKRRIGYTYQYALVFDIHHILKTTNEIFKLDLSVSNNEEEKARAYQDYLTSLAVQVDHLKNFHARRDQFSKVQSFYRPLAKHYIKTELEVAVELIKDYVPVSERAKRDKKVILQYFPL